MRDLYRETFDEIHASEALRQEVMNMTKQERAAVKRQIPRMALLAAVIVLALAGTTLAVAFPGIQEWFGQQWTKETGKPIEKDQMGIITGLTDEVGISAEADGITVTVDSITRGREGLWILMKIDSVPPEEELEALLGQYERPIEGLPEGITPPSNRHYAFLHMELVYMPAGTGEGWLSAGLLQESRGEDNSLNLLYYYEPPTDMTYTPLDAEGLSLKFEGLQWGYLGGKVPLGAGPWELDIPLKAIKDQPMLTTGPCTLSCYAQFDGPWDTETMGPYPEAEVQFREIEVTATGVTLYWADPEQTEEAKPPSRIFLVMKDGTEVKLETAGSFWHRQPDGSVVTRKCWPVPVDLSQAEALRYRDEQVLELK